MVGPSRDHTTKGKAIMLTAQARIDEMLDARTPFDRVEDYIERRTDLPPDSRSMLWLYAWVETDRAERRRCVAELLAGVAHDLGGPVPGCQRKPVRRHATRR